MPQLFLYLIFALIAAVDDQSLQGDANNPFDHGISFVEQDVSSNVDQSSDDDGFDYNSSHAQPAVFTRRFAHSYILTSPSTHSSYRAYSARAPPVFLS